MYLVSIEHPWSYKVHLHQCFRVTKEVRPSQQKDKLFVNVHNYTLATKGFVKFSSALKFSIFLVVLLLRSRVLYCYNSKIIAGVMRQLGLKHINSLEGRIQ